MFVDQYKNNNNNKLESQVIITITGIYLNDCSPSRYSQYNLFLETKPTIILLHFISKLTNK